jgi:ribosomal protein L11 methyltransferase
MYLQLSFDLGSLDPEAVEAVCFERGALAVTFADSRDDPVLEPAPGEFRLWPATRLVVLFSAAQDLATLSQSLASGLGLTPQAIHTQAVADKVWEREWLKDFHAMRFGKRLWICPHHELVADPNAVVVNLDPGLAFGTGTHASTALCLTWLDAHAHLLRAPAGHSVERPASGLDAHAHLLRAPAGHSVEGPAPALVIDYGCGSGVLALAAAKLGAAAVHCFDIDPQALTATQGNALANAVASRVHVHEHRDGLPHGADVLLANILSGPLCELATTFASLLRPGGQIVLAGLMDHEAADVTAAYAACFHVERFGDRDGWTCLAGRRN